jgi:hypothetical protein
LMDILINDRTYRPPTARLLICRHGGKLSEAKFCR